MESVHFLSTLFTKKEEFKWAQLTLTNIVAPVAKSRSREARRHRIPHHEPILALSISNDDQYSERGKQQVGYLGVLFLSINPKLFMMWLIRLKYLWRFPVNPWETTGNWRYPRIQFNASNGDRKTSQHPNWAFSVCTFSDRKSIVRRIFLTVPPKFGWQINSQTVASCCWSTDTGNRRRNAVLLLQPCWKSSRILCQLTSVFLWHCVVTAASAGEKRWICGKKGAIKVQKRQGLRKLCLALWGRHVNFCFQRTWYGLKHFLKNKLQLASFYDIAAW